MRLKTLHVLLFCSALTVSCKKQIDTSKNFVDGKFRTSLIDPTSWTIGPLTSSTDPAAQILPNAELQPLNVVYGGNKIFKCNNPEIFTGNGWLMQTSRTDASRGGNVYPINGNATAYMFHINQSGLVKYYHLMVSNPGTAPITLTSKGSYYNNSEKPLTGSGTGPSYFVAKDWINNTLRKVQSEPITIAPSQAVEVFKVQANVSNMIDARFELNTSGNAYYYTVVTSTGNLDDAINATQGGPAAGTYLTESTNAYGREAGVYQYSEVTADNNLDIPNRAAHIGFALNTSNKFAAAIENQTAAKLMNLTGSSSNTYGNYGHRYLVKFHLINKNATSKNVKLFFASNSVNAAQSNATWNGPIKLNGTVIDVYTQLNNPRKELASWVIPPGVFNATIEFYVPGLITANQQLIFDSN
ncbi:hypothetical protein DHW03_16115 [Pedobacter yonginense]|uniref:Uncharacterized protein n=1 Tax=Pedobacter yonginense TaxID=651869 RepID=A0A317EHM3_9SPHI|nr:DUF3370 family protein [Pedobacter yonginense]PWS26310.1 hypothetical protein DHW03_16115 [Pedobacter yonginense]